MRARAFTHAKLALLAAVALTAAMRTPERNPNRPTSLQWTADVRERLRILEEHAADAARERMRSTVQQDSRGWSTPQSPAAGDGRVR